MNSISTHLYKFSHSRTLPIPKPYLTPTLMPTTAALHNYRPYLSTSALEWQCLRITPRPIEHPCWCLASFTKALAPTLIVAPAVGRIASSSFFVFKNHSCYHYVFKRIFLVIAQQFTLRAGFDCLWFYKESTYYGWRVGRCYLFSSIVDFHLCCCSGVLLLIC